MTKFAVFTVADKAPGANGVRVSENGKPVEFKHKSKCTTWIKGRRKPRNATYVTRRVTDREPDLARGVPDLKRAVSSPKGIEKRKSFVRDFNRVTVWNLERAAKYLGVKFSPYTVLKKDMIADLLQAVDSVELTRVTKAIEKPGGIRNL